MNMFRFVQCSKTWCSIQFDDWLSKSSESSIRFLRFNVRYLFVWVRSPIDEHDRVCLILKKMFEFVCCLIKWCSNPLLLVCHFKKVCISFSTIECWWKSHLWKMWKSFLVCAEICLVQSPLLAKFSVAILFITKNHVWERQKLTVFDSFKAVLRHIVKRN